jgi:hypothetical protein
MGAVPLVENEKGLGVVSVLPGCRSWGNFLRPTILTDEIAPKKGIFAKIPKMIVGQTVAA